MVYEKRDIDLNTIKEYFTECGDYTKGVILEELEYWRKTTDFLCLISESDRVINGILIGYRNRNNLWLSQIWHRPGSSLVEARKAMEYTKDWARKRGIKTLTGETKRNEMSAIKRYGFVEESVNLICRL